MTKPLAYGDAITIKDVRQIPWPKSALPEAAFTEEETLFPKGVRPRAVLRAMEAFEPSLASKVTEPDEDAGITTRLGKGMRAFAVSVDVSSGVSGFLRPDDTVDVYWTGSVAGTDGEMTAQRSHEPRRGCRRRRKLCRTVHRQSGHCRYFDPVGPVDLCSGQGTGPHDPDAAVRRWPPGPDGSCAIDRRVGRGVKRNEGVRVVKRTTAADPPPTPGKKRDHRR